MYSCICTLDAWHGIGSYAPATMSAYAKYANYPIHRRTDPLSEAIHMGHHKTRRQINKFTIHTSVLKFHAASRSKRRKRNGENSKTANGVLKSEEIAFWETAVPILYNTRSLMITEALPFTRRPHCAFERPRRARARKYLSWIIRVYRRLLQRPFVVAAPRAAGLTSRDIPGMTRKVPLSLALPRRAPRRIRSGSPPSERAWKSFVR